MDQKDLEKCLLIPCHTEEFFSEVFWHTSQTSHTDPLQQIFDLSQEALLSFLCDSSNLQNSFCLRSERRARLAAGFILTEKGDIDQHKLHSLISLLEERGYIFYPRGFSDGVLTHHMLNFAKKLKDTPHLSSFLKKFRLPLCHKAAEELIRSSLGFHQEDPLTDLDLKKAILTACFSYLRQNVGSCFATAPAILIQSEQVEHLLSDLYELLMTGKLTKTFAGVEYCVPLSPTAGSGDLYQTIHPLDPSFAKSPGLMQAFLAAGLLDEKLTLQEKIHKIKEIAAKQAEEVCVKDLLRNALLTHFSLQESDLVAYEKIESSLVKSQGFGGTASAHLSADKIKKVQLFLEKEKKAKIAFTSFVDNPLLKAWEFTLASFSEGKTDFTTWNLYFSLGFHPEQEGGIGEIIYKVLGKQFDSCKQKAEQYQEEYIVAFEALRATETLLKAASTEADLRRLKVEFNSRLHHLQACQSIRDQANREASALSSFYPRLQEAYKHKFQESFQEIYDADMTDVEIGLYEDRPAGFRLVYKHGRSNASLWTLIYTANSYVEALAEFFLSIEPQIASECPWDEEGKLIAEITTALIAHVRSDVFLETAFTRVARAHKLPSLQPKKSATKKPWSYTSGGSMMTLLQAYYKRELPFTKEEFWAESETNLLIFLLNALKNMPLTIQEACVSPHKGMLISSPTHAFILYPGFKLLKDGWQEDIFTYSWVRDQVVKPRQEFYNAQVLSPAMQSFLLEELEKKLPSIYTKKLKNCVFSHAVSIPMFRNGLEEILPGDIIDSFLYESLPLVPGSSWKQAVTSLLKDLDCKNLSTFLESFPDTPQSILTAKTLKNLAKAFYLLDTKTHAFSFDLHRYIEQKAEKLSFAPPAPLIFADTNWMGYYFGFVVNPGTNQLELWKLDYTGSLGSKMSVWDRFLDGSDQTLWNVYTHFFEYQ